MRPGLRGMPDRRPMSTSGASRKATRKTRSRGRLRRRATVWSISARLTTRKADGSPGAQERRAATQGGGDRELRVGQPTEKAGVTKMTGGNSFAYTGALPVDVED